MEANQITRQVLDFQKSAFSNWLDILSIVQDQADFTGNAMLDQAIWIPEKERLAIANWVSACKNEGDRYKAYVKESFSALEKFIDQKLSAAPAKPQNRAAEEKNTVSVIEK
jgi:hypothetical protein